MTVGSRRAFLGATVIAVVCLIGAATAVGRAQTGQDTPAVTDNTFKNIMLLKGIPVDTFLDAMGMFANAMGNDCTYCHASGAALDRDAFAVATPRIQRARQMIVMMNTINKTYFAGQPRVTCFTCHGGNQSPRSDPNIALQYSTPPEDPNVRDFPTDPTASADRIFDRYLQAVGGAARVAALASFTARGTYEGFDTLFTKVPVDIFAKAPYQYATVVHMTAGDSVRVYNGSGGWMAGPDTAVPLLTLTSGNLDRARLEALVAFPTGLKQAFPQWRVGRAVMNDQEVRVVQGTENGQPVLNLYFDESGILVRLVRWTLTPVGFVPTQIDYSDFREVAGVKIPFRRKVSQTYMQMTVELSDVQPNARIDAARFAKPAPAKPAV
ncbi:MAG: photosynthetic reaction center cytochrome c subunit [Acidobacteria bacterium]|nr:photosynthetic reaction center cytochrome c subunit [Acidobacteriota bacterium]